MGQNELQSGLNRGGNVKGNHVHVWGRISVDPTAASVATKLGISLPVASAMTIGTELRGVAATDVGNVGSITADVTNDRAQLNFTIANDVSQGWNVMFSYEVK